MKKFNLILGGGLAGLSTAYHLRKHPHLIIEKENQTGGTARSFFINGFTFDFTGHLLHLHHPYTRKLITHLLKGRFYSCTRNTAIFSENALTPYPFQANTNGLPENSIDECVLGFLDAYLDNQSRRKPFKKYDFKKWSREIFGEGIAKKFMIPYNEKLYQMPTQKMTTDWCGRFVPQPKLEEVIKGALESQEKKFGYNATFLYPKKGGIQELARQLSLKKLNISLNTGFSRVDWEKRIVTLSNGNRIEYDNLINSIPMVEFLKRLKNKPRKIKTAEKKLKCVSILCLNIGVNRPKISDKSWIYFPEKEFPFYRVGFPMNFTPHVVPRGCSSMYVEVPMNRAIGKSKRQIVNEVRKGLIKANILKGSDKLPVVQYLPIKYAYVTYDRERKKALKIIFDFLKKNHIQSIGRYGAWKYSFMEEAILDGKAAAETILRERWKKKK